MVRVEDASAAGDPRPARAIRCAGSCSSSSVAAIGGSASCRSSSVSRRTWSRTTWPSSDTPASSAPGAALPTGATSTTGPTCSAAATCSAKPAPRSIPGSRSRRRRAAVAPRALDRGCCSSAPATAPAPRSPKRSSSTDRAARSRLAAPAAIPSRCTRTQCGSMARARHRHLGPPDEVAHPLRPQPIRPRHHALRQGARDLPGVPGRTARRALEHRRPGRAGGSDEATYPAFEQVADEIDERVALLLADLRTRPPERTHHGLTPRP